PRHVSRPGEDAGRVQARLGFLQDPEDDPGRPGVHATRREQVPAADKGVSFARPPGAVARRRRRERAMSLFASQILIGLINGSFYALLSLGMAIIFGLLNVINFAHGAFYMMGAFLAWIFLQYFGLPYWAALVVSPAIVGVLGLVVERAVLARLRDIDHIYGWLATFGLALM